MYVQCNFKQYIHIYIYSIIHGINRTNKHAELFKESNIVKKKSFSI